MNTVILTGYLVNDFTMKKGVATTSIAVNRKYGDKTDFINIKVFGKTADFCVKYLRKGYMVALNGEWQVDKYNEKVYNTCVVNSIEKIAGDKKQEEVQTELPTYDVSDDEEMVITEDDLPF